MKEFIRSIILRILTLEARLIVRKYRPKIMVVTGSVGKTSTKDAAYAALAGSTFVRKSEKSYNSDIGVPLTVLGVPNGWSNLIVWLKNILNGMLILLIRTPYPEWLVTEVGADRPGDLSRSLAWVWPDVVIATRIPELPVHVEFYASPEDVFAEESYPLSRLRTGGVAVVNADDPRLAALGLPEGVRRIGYGFSPKADVRVSRLRTLASERLPAGISFDVGYQGGRAHISIPDVLGRAHATAVAGGIGGALASGVPLDQIARSLSILATPPGRMRLVPGLKGTMLIDDTYNSSPAAVSEALTALKDAPLRGKRIAILGDMMELGNYSADEHLKAGALAAECADLIIAVGVRAQGIALGAVKAGRGEAVKSFERGPDAASYVLSVMTEGDLVLIKGSQSIRLERVTKALMAEPERARDLLCRQDAEWLAR